MRFLCLTPTTTLHIQLNTWHYIQLYVLKSTHIILNEVESLLATIAIIITTITTAKTYYRLQILYIIAHLHNILNYYYRY